jgi:hypothetical protein
MVRSVMTGFMKPAIAMGTMVLALGCGGSTIAGSGEGGKPCMD